MNLGPMGPNGPAGYWEEPEFIRAINEAAIYTLMRQDEGWKTPQRAVKTRSSGLITPLRVFLERIERKSKTKGQGIVLYPLEEHL